MPHDFCHFITSNTESDDEAGGTASQLPSLSQPISFECSSINAAGANNRKTKYLGSLRRLVVITILVLQNTVNFTETNTRISPRNIPSTNSTPNNNHYHKIKQTRIRRELKISPTRIRLSNSKRHPIAPIPERSLRNASATSALRGNQQSVEDRPLMPAYELIWPSDGEPNTVKISARQIRLVRPSSANKKRQFEAVKSKKDGLLRNALPSPQEASESKLRGSLLRAARDKRQGRVGQQVESQADQENAQPRVALQADEVGEGVESEGSAKTDNNDMIDADYEPEDYSPENLALNNRRLSSVNINTVDDDNVMARADTLGRLSASPVYPPGDLDILYSDALLVYVKDFNQYVKR